MRLSSPINSMNFGRVPMTSRSAYGNPLAVPGGVHSSGTPGTPGHTPSLSPQRDISTAHHPPPPSGNYSASSLGAPTATQPVRGGVGTLDAYQNLSKIGEGTYGCVLNYIYLTLSIIMLKLGDNYFIDLCIKLLIGAREKKLH